MEKEALSVQLLIELVELCKLKSLVRKLSESLEVTPQSIYAWTTVAAGGGPVIRGRAATQRLLEITRVREKELAEIAQFARAAVDKLDALERQS